MRPVLAATTKKSATAPRTTVAAPSRLALREYPSTPSTIANTPADTSSLAPRRTRMMPPTPRTIPTMQESLPASSFNASLRSLSRLGLSCTSSRSTWLVLPSLFELKLPSCALRYVKGPRPLTPALTAASSGAVFGAYRPLVPVRLPRTRLRKTSAYHVADREEGEEHPPLGRVEAIHDKRRDQYGGRRGQVDEELTRLGGSLGLGAPLAHRAYPRRLGNLTPSKINYYRVKASKSKLK